ncbi:MAG: hypothetical protein ACE5IR_11665 [bacterium]
MRTKTDILSEEFLEKAKLLKTNVEPVKVLKARVYQIAEANVLIRAASKANTNGRYFFGINYITVEEIANLDNPFIAFICGSNEKTLIIPAQLFFNNLSRISHDRNGEYKILIDEELNLVLKGRGNRIDCSEFINDWDILLKPFETLEIRNTAEESLHSILQGRLLEIGNIRGYETFCPDKSKKFNNRKLKEITTLKTCPELQFSDYNSLKQIDVIWFKPKGSYFIPEYAFEVELSTGVWSGVGRMATLIDYSNVKLYVVANDSKKYNQVINSFSEYNNRYRFIAKDLVGELYSAEKNLKQLRIDIGL